MNDPVVSAKGVSKWYGQVIGLNNFSVEIGHGITGIVGPNGSGKSTFFKIVTGTIRSEVGEIAVLGQEPWRNPVLLQDIGFCPDYDFLPFDLTGREYLRFAGGMHGMEGAALGTRTDEVLGIFGMKAAADRKMGGYSKGMVQRIKMAGSMLHDPKLLLLDEPLTGTDPIARRDLMDLIADLNEVHGHDIIVSSHVLHEIERLTSNVALIYKGRAVASGGIHEIRSLMSDHPHNIVLEGRGMVELAKVLIGRPYTVSVEMRPERKGLIVRVSDPEAFFDSVADLIRESGCDLDTMQSLDDDLEAVFKYLVG
ncbi:MAG TPA: ABC transporter ATP-binding protein [Methanomassiliicoccales archaeon]